MDFDWKSAVKTIAPWLGTALGGPVGGMAAKMVSTVLIGNENGTEEEISQAMQMAGPEQLLALKNADHDFKLKCKELGLNKLKAITGDKDSARRMQATTKSRTPAFLAYILTFIVGLMILGLFNVQIPEENREIIHIVFGSVMTAWLGAMQFFHGATIKEE